MPTPTREAMLGAVTSGERIIVGAYVDREGGTCPMLAAHRAGGRTDFLAFAKAWDRFTNARGRARPATRRELAVLVSLLQESLSEDDGLDLKDAIADHRGLVQRSALELAAERRRVFGAADPPGEILARRVRRSARRRALAAARP